MKKRRAGLIQVTRAIFDELHRYQRIRLPEDVHIAAWKDKVDRDCVLVRLEGGGLPESCEVGSERLQCYELLDCEVPAIGPNEVPTLSIKLAIPETEHIT